ncbi:MAG: nitroreductase [Planctomycetota bacterium]
MPSIDEASVSASVDLWSMDAIGFLESRRSPRLRDLSGPAPNPNQLKRLLQIASRSPDHGKLVPWRFIVIRDAGRDRLNAKIAERFEERFPDATPERRAESKRRMSYAPVVIAVVSRPVDHPKIPEWEQILTAGAVCMNLLHGARALGFGAVWLTEWYAYDRQILTHLGLSDTEQVAGFLHVGAAPTRRDDRERPAVEDIMVVYDEARGSSEERDG